MKDIVADPTQKIGQPVAIRMGKVEVYGRVIELKGKKIGSIYSIMQMATPGGAIVEAGIAWFENIEEDNESLKGFEEEAKKEGEWYADKLEKKVESCAEDQSKDKEV